MMIMMYILVFVFSNIQEGKYAFKLDLHNYNYIFFILYIFKYIIISDRYCIRHTIIFVHHIEKVCVTYVLNDLDLLLF